MKDEERSGLKTDPVCRMEVREEESVIADCDGIVYYFCSEGCRDKFLKDRTCARTAYDLIIIGGGPAGLTAAVYAATLKMEALLVAQDLGGQAVDSTKIENYLGFDFVTGPELIDKFKHHLLDSHYIDHLMSEVEGIELHEGGFKVTTSELTAYTSTTCSRPDARSQPNPFYPPFSASVHRRCTGIKKEVSAVSRNP